MIDHASRQVPPGQSPRPTPINDDTELLRRYVEDGAQDAFAELVHRHLNLVYSAARRQLNGHAHFAADAAQMVFTDLARKAGSLLGHRLLAGWLFTSTRYAARKLVRGERRRHAREQEAYGMETMNHNETPLPDWQQVHPVLDEALGELNEADREAILMRYFEGRDYASVGDKLKVNDNTARMRVERALDKLRALLERRGVTSTSAALALVLANQAVVSAPTGLAATVTGAALAGGAAVTGAATGGMLWASLMNMTKLHVGLGGALVVAGGVGLTVQGNTNSSLHDEAARLRQENAAIATLANENRQLMQRTAEVAELRRDDAELVQLQREADVLRNRLQAQARAEEARQARKDRFGLVYDISALDETPGARFQARPQYPAAMREAGITGEVVVDFLVDADGGVQDAYALRSSRREFESAAVEAVSKWKFKPGQKGGRDVITHLQVPIVFTLGGAGKETSPPSPQTNRQSPDPARP